MTKPPAAFRAPNQGRLQAENMISIGPSPTEVLLTTLMSEAINLARALEHERSGHREYMLDTQEEALERIEKIQALQHELNHEREEHSLTRYQLRLAEGALKSYMVSFGAAVLDADEAPPGLKTWVRETLELIGAAPNHAGIMQLKHNGERLEDQPEDVPG